MRISRVSEQSALPVTTLKYYLREGLVHEGVRLSGNQTDYDQTHVQRVRLVRALLDTGGLSVAAAKRVLSTLDAEPIAELMVIGTVVGDTLAAGLRRLAHQDATADLFPVPDPIHRQEPS